MGKYMDDNKIFQNDTEEEKYSEEILISLKIKLIKTFFFGFVTIIVTIMLVILLRPVKLLFLLAAICMIAAVIYYCITTYKTIANEAFVVLEGECAYTQRTGYRKQIKMCYFEDKEDGKVYSIQVRSKLLSYKKGCLLRVYVTNKSEFIERDGSTKIVQPFHVECVKVASEGDDE